MYENLIQIRRQFF